MASVAVKSFLMAIVATHTFCGDISPNTLFLECYDSVAYVGGSIAAVAIMGAVFGYYMIRIRAFDPIFARIMKADFIVTAMFFAVAFTAPSLVAFKVMIWLYGIWVLGMLLAPFNSEQTLLKKSHAVRLTGCSWRSSNSSLRSFPRTISAVFHPWSDGEQHSQRLRCWERVGSLRIYILHCEKCKSQFVQV